MASIKLNDWKFSQEKDGIWVQKYHKIMGMYEELKRFTLQELMEYADKDLTFTHTNREFTIPNIYIQHAIAWAKEA